MVYVYGYAFKNIALLLRFCTLSLTSVGKSTLFLLSEAANLP